MFQVNHMKNKALFSSKDKSNKLKCHLLQFLFGALRVNASQTFVHLHYTRIREASINLNITDIICEFFYAFAICIFIVICC